MGASLDGVAPTRHVYIHAGLDGQKVLADVRKCSEREVVLLHRHDSRSTCVFTKSHDEQAVDAIFSTMQKRYTGNCPSAKDAVAVWDALREAILSLVSEKVLAQHILYVNGKEVATESLSKKWAL